MKYIVKLLLISILMVHFSSCEKDPSHENSASSFIPEKFKVDIPNSLSYTSTMKSVNTDTLQGAAIYQNLKTFIAVGETAADVVEAIMWSIKVYNIENVIDMTYTSDEDGRVKHLVVEEEATYMGDDFEYMLTITDQEFEGNTDNGVGMQVFWNNNPVAGIAIIKPINWNYSDKQQPKALYRVEYSSSGNAAHEEYMIVELDSLSLTNNITDKFYMDALKMYVGKNGNQIDVYGNSNHPNAQFYTDDIGFNWAFVASADQSLDIAVAEVGLPSSMLDSDHRTVLLEDYSIKNVFTEQVKQWILDQWNVVAEDALIAPYLLNTDAPGFFNTHGFVQGREAPSSDYTQLENSIKSLKPYNPKVLQELSIHFK